MRKVFLCALAALAAVTASAQGGNTGTGGYDGDYKSLSDRVLNLEKKTDNFNLFLNYASSFQVGDDGNGWSSAFRAKQLRLEIKGAFGDHLTYRLRHRLNRSQAGADFENFSKATDIMMAGYRINDHWTLMGGKLCQFWGGFEFDENPMYIYEYSEMVNNMDNFLAGAAIAFYPMAGQEFVLNVSDSYSNHFETEYGAGALLQDGTALKASRHPLAYILNWNGNLFGGLVETRWSVGAYNQAEGYWDKMAFLGQKLNLPKFQVYFDWMSAWEGLDRLRIASSELGGGRYLEDVHYNSFVTKANWQFAPGFNLMLKGMYETASLKDFHNYRTAWGYISSLEYYPVQDQDFRVFLAYVGRRYDYTAASALPGWNTNRIELGFMYRIKAY
ncbi:MAG: porin [Bacteroidales bacterium]|nr:porin [Bacteroidales bacterium]